MTVVNRISGRTTWRLPPTPSLLGAMLICVLASAPTWAQPAGAKKPGSESQTATQTAAQPAESLPPPDPLALAESALASKEPEPESAIPAGAVASGQINILDLLVKGGYLMIPIAAMSLIVATFGLERWLGLRRRRVLSPKLMRGIAALAGGQNGFDPRRAYNLCRLHPCAASRVIRAMLLKAGRPHAEVERAVNDAAQREADRLYANVRWLSLAAGVAPLLGLLGTVWGMIQAFFATANLPTGANKAEYLAQGIYVALVTTFAGLAVAIPAAVLAHLFEGRIQKLFRELDETMAGLLSRMERLEGKLRVRHELVVPPGTDSNNISEDNLTLKMYRTPK